MSGINFQPSEAWKAVYGQAGEGCNCDCEQGGDEPDVDTMIDIIELQGKLIAAQARIIQLLEKPQWTGPGYIHVTDGTKYQYQGGTISFGSSG